MQKKYTYTILYMAHALLQQDIYLRQGPSRRRVRRVMTAPGRSVVRKAHGQVSTSGLHMLQRALAQSHR